MKQPQPVAKEPALPKLGAVVIYRVTQAEANAVNELRTTAAHRHAGNKVHGGDELPLIVTKVHEKSFNGQLLLDGNDTCWVKSTTIGTDEGQCQKA